jgi:hypothetical protein
MPQPKPNPPPWSSLVLPLFVGCSSSTGGGATAGDGTDAGASSVSIGSSDAVETGGYPTTGAGGESGPATSGAGDDSSTSATGSDDGGSTDYDENLAKILASTFRNTLEDDSPHRYTPSAELYDQPDLYDPYEIYMGGYEGDYGGESLYEPTYFPGNGAGTVRTSCEVSHFAYDDPAVLPGQPEASHLQMFIGNTHANAFSTYETLRDEGGGTCNGHELNRTAYWMPAMFDGNGNVVVPSLVKFYYKTEMPAGIGNVAVYPENLQLVADRENNVDGNLDLATYRCNNIWNGAKHTPSNTIPTCSSPNGDGPGVLEVLIYFDHCWNGSESTTGDWSANLVDFVAPQNYWHSSVCPDTHPILLPALAFHVFFDIAEGEDTSAWFLSSDVDPSARVVQGIPGETQHAGWFGAWNPDINAEFNEKCNNTPAECGSGLLADPANEPNPRALARRTDWVSGLHRIPVADIYAQLCTASSERPFDPANGGAAAAWCRPPS